MAKGSPTVAVRWAPARARHRHPLLIVNADDLGVSPGVSLGIAAAYDHGAVTSASLMVNTPGLHAAVSVARARPRLSVGLHFNLTYGRPLSPPADVPTLIGEDGRFPARPDWAAGEVEAELARQFEAYRRTGLPLTHLDAHHFIDDTSEVVFAWLADLARRVGVPLRTRRRRDALRAAGVRTTDHLVSDVYSGEDGLQRLTAHLADLGPGVTELICHPGHADEVLRTISPWVEERERELRVFTDRAPLRAITAAGLQLVSFRDVRLPPHALHSTLLRDRVARRQHERSF